MILKTIPISEERGSVLLAYLQDVGHSSVAIGPRPAMLILPGGGYTHLSPRESDPVAWVFLRAGFQVFTLNYSVGEHAAWPNPLTDYELAAAHIRAHAEEYQLDPRKLCVIGFSAGGHLAAAAATKAENRPDAAILGYALTLGEDARRHLADAPDTVSAIDEKTPPCFVFATADDGVVPSRNSLAFAAEMVKKRRPVELHLYAYGSHGFSVGDPTALDPAIPLCERAKDWTEEAVSWLGELFGRVGC